MNDKFKEFLKIAKDIDKKNGVDVLHEAWRSEHDAWRSDLDKRYPGDVYDDRDINKHPDRAEGYNKFKKGWSNYISRQTQQIDGFPIEDSLKKLEAKWKTLRESWPPKNPMHDLAWMNKVRYDLLSQLETLVRVIKPILDSNYLGHKVTRDD